MPVWHFTVDIGGATQAQSQASHTELLKLQDFREKGALTEEEFQYDKKRVLGN